MVTAGVFLQLNRRGRGITQSGVWPSLELEEGIRVETPLSPAPASLHPILPILPSVSTTPEPVPDLSELFCLFVCFFNKTKYETAVSVVSYVLGEPCCGAGSR